MNKYIVITSINPPTKTIKTYAGHAKGDDRYKVIVVGDTKSPNNWSCDNVDYFSIEKQRSFSFKCERHLPVRHYCRKNIGYLIAINSHADIIFDTDDDNIPYDTFAPLPFEGLFHTPAAQGNQWVNIYKYFTDKKCWPRGFPLDLICSDHPLLLKEKQSFEVSVWQGLADNDPDVDAIYRLTEKKLITFDKNPPIVLQGTQPCPTNSQNTTFVSEAFPLLYLPHTVTFRFTDILRGLILQQILAIYNKCIGFHAATVYQERNVHNLMKDFESEIPCYLHSRSIPEIVNSAISSSKSMEDNLFETYRVLSNKKIVQTSELECLSGWLHDCRSRC